MVTHSVPEGWPREDAPVTFVFFDNLPNAPVPLEDPTVVEGTGVTHLIYRVRRR